MQIIPQDSPEWAQARLGHATASRMADLTAKVKSGDYGASRKNYAAELVIERLTQQPTNGYKSPEMIRGTEKEPEAKAAYQFFQNVDVVPGGFVRHPNIAWAGGSPDGFVGDDGLAQFKCPNTWTHIETLLGSSVPGVYLKQMQWEMAITGRHWCDFVSYDDRLPPSMQLFVKRIPRDDKMIGDLEREVELFLAEVAQAVDQLERKYPAK